LITFIPLVESHFSLLLKWLETPHVKKWWDKELIYTLETVKEKYASRVQGYQLVNGAPKSIHAYIICVAEQPVGYIQTYNAYDFSRQQPLTELPESLGTFDVFIGEAAYVGIGIGSQIIKKFMDEYILKHYQYAFVDPDYHNETAVSAYEKAGFVILKRIQNVFWMIAYQPTVRLSIQASIALEIAFKKCFLEKDTLWVFGSRTDLNKKGGDIDLYVETHAKTADEAVNMKLKFLSHLQRILGEQKIDLVLNLLNTSTSLPIYIVAKTKGVKII